MRRPKSMILPNSLVTLAEVVIATLRSFVIKSPVGKLLSATALFFCFVLPACRPPSSAPQQRRPNILLIVADDLGYGDLGATGAPDISTPNIDRLAAEGVRFTNAYANAPVCTPTRVALLTGQYQQRTGYDRVLYVNERELGIPSRLVLLPELLKAAGYTTALFGKWHLGYPQESFPTRHGFDRFIGFVAGNIDYFAHTDGLGNHDLWRNETEIHDNRYFTDLVVDESIDFLDEHHEQPFFLYVPFSAPHAPFQGPEHRATAGNQEITRRTNRTRQVYKSMVEAMDRGVGRLLTHLEKLQLADRTVVFFMSDNGGLPTVARNAPFSGYKGTLWEGGIHVPLLVRWPGRIPPGTVSDALVAGMDLFPTIVTLAGASFPEGHSIDGVNLLPVLSGESLELEREALYFHYRSPRSRNEGGQRALIKGSWKYLLDEEGNEHLFDLSRDLAEKNDLARKHSDRLVKMREGYDRWLQEVFAGVTRLPERNPPP